MEYSKIKHTLSVEEAIRQIKNNNSNYFVWFPVKNKTGCIFELGGTSKDLKAYIPRYDSNGIPEKYPLNEMVNLNYSITLDWNHPKDGPYYDEEKFISIVKNKDFRNAIFEPGMQEEVVVVQSKPARTIFK